METAARVSVIEWNGLFSECFGELINAFSPRDSKQTVGKVQLAGKGFEINNSCIDLEKTM